MVVKNNTADQLPKAEGKFYLPMNLQFFAEGDPPPSDPPSDPPQDPPGGDPKDPPADPPKTFTQDDVNGIAAKEAKKAQEKILKQLGIDDIKSAKEGMEKFKEWQESQKTDAQKQSERLKELEENSTTLSDENVSLKAQLSALKSGVKSDSVEDVVTLAKTMVTDEMDMDAAIKKVVEKYPHFAGEEQQEEGKPSFTTGKHQKGSQTELDKWLTAFKN